MTSIVILGASTRAAAGSARRAGLTPWSADLFADADLERIATVRKVPGDRYPEGLIDALDEAPPGPVMYTGALENRPDLIARIDRPLWGNPPDVLRAVRSPEAWTRSLREHGLPYPAISLAPRSGRWLLKPRKSAGGFGIQHFHGQPFHSRTHFLQQGIDGLACSAIFVGTDDGAHLVGVTEQLLDGFRYVGSIGPLPISTHWQSIGDALVQAFRLRGLFGVDAILRDGVPWPVEINPRYTASVEILERALRIATLRWHGDRPLTPGPSPPEYRGRGENVLGKRVLYARRELGFPREGPWDECEEYADIPHAGEIIEQGRPVMTLFASGATIDECRARLQEKVKALDQRLWGS